MALSLVPQIIPPGTKQTAVVISASADAGDWVGPLKLIGTANIDGRKVVREVRAATITWPVPQAAPTITRLDRELGMPVRDKAPFILAAEKDRIVVAQGERISVPVKLTRAVNFTKTVNVTALSAPPGYGVQPLALATGKDSGTVNLDGKGMMAMPGVYTLILRGQTGPPGAKPPPPKPAVTE